MDPTTPPENQFQLAYIDLAFALAELFFNVMLNIFGFVTGQFLSNVFDVLEQIFGPLPSLPNFAG